MAPKGKQGTKGQKQIFEENKETLTFYFYIIAGANVAFILTTYFLFWESFTSFYMMLVFFTWTMYGASYKFMSSMATATYGPNGTLQDGGIDVNMKEGMAENMKDLIIVTAITQVLSLLSNYFWLILLTIPGRAFYMLWVNILSPWFFAEAPESTEEDEKKQQKRERKIKYQRGR